MNINTPWFRGALSIAPIWLAIVAFSAVRSYAGAYRPPSQVTLPDWAMTKCSDLKIDWRGSNIVGNRQPTPQEVQDCLALEDKSYRQLVESDNTDLLYQSFRTFVLGGIAPALAVLFAVAFWRRLTLAGGDAGRRYVRWLREGSQDDPDGR
jgi:hypothetical protein